jgi:hypothetical protein
LAFLGTSGLITGTASSFMAAAAVLKRDERLEDMTCCEVAASDVRRPLSARGLKMSEIVAVLLFGYLLHSRVGTISLCSRMRI